MDPLTQWLQQGDGSAILNLPTRSAGSALSTDGQRFLRFHLGFEDTALLPIDEVREVLRIAATDILPVPHMPESVLGVYNWRGEIIWTIDLNQLVGFPAIAPDLTATSSAIAIVLECDGQNLGLVVPQIEDIEWHDSPNVQPPSAGLFPDRLLPFVQGYLSEASSMVLNPSAIARASAQQAG
jgi:chemotaxis signal transduction protein